MPTTNNTDATASNQCESPADPDKRKTIKILGGAAALATGISAASVNAATNHRQDQATATPNAQLPHHITINIQMNRSGLDDWVLIENMTEQPLTLRAFNPRFTRYNNKLLDLNALLSRQQRGKNQLEIWPNHAWTHSMTGATRSRHTLRPDTPDTLQCGMVDSCRSLQIRAHVQASGRVVLLA